MNTMIDPTLGVRELREGIYDTVSYAAGAAVPATVNFFGHTRAANGPQVTNMARANQLQAGESIDVYQVRVGLLNVVAADVALIRAAMALEITIAGKRVLTTPLAAVPYGANQDLAYQLFEIPEGMKLQIQEGVSFQVQLIGAGVAALGAAPATGVDIQICLDGVHTVPVN